MVPEVGGALPLEFGVNLAGNNAGRSVGFDGICLYLFYCSQQDPFRAN